MGRMRKKNHRFLAAMLVCCLTALSVQAGIQSGLDQLINRVNPNANLGMVVIDLSSGETLYNRNANHLFIPASNMKLFSEAAVLIALGPDYRFENQLSTSAPQIDQGMLKGNLFLHLSGDPSFNRHHLKHLLSALKNWNVTAIQGNLLIDSSLALVDSYPPGWLTSDLAYGYGAPIAPLMLDSNRLIVTVNPGSHAGAAAVVEVNDGSSPIVINNEVKTKADAKGCGVGFSLDKNNLLTVRGCVGVGQWAVQQQLAIKNPLAYAQGMIKNELLKLGIQFQGQVLLGKAPAGALVLSTEHSKPLIQLMADTFKAFR